MSKSRGATTNAAPRSLNPLKRKSIVYVDIPPSPLHGSYLKKTDSPRSLTTPRTVQTPLSSKALNMNRQTATDGDAPLKKRKLSDPLNKLIVKRPAAPPKSHKTILVTSSTDSEFPRGFFYCHQCNKKRDRSVELHCTVKDQTRCKGRYCKMCLRNRYGEDMETIKTRPMPSDRSLRVEHVVEAGYMWKCPKCSGNCNCCRCRKAKGLEPTGNLTREARKAGNSAAELLAQNPNATGILPGKGQQVIPDKKEPKEKKSTESTTQSNEHQMKVRAPRKPRTVPEPRWEEVPTDLDCGQAEDRFLLREFILRFSPLMDISMKHLEDLDEFNSLSDACAKTVTLNLLRLIAADSHANVQKTLKITIKKITSGGLSPNAIWMNLSELRELLPTSILSLPDPSPPAVEIHRTRASGSVHQPLQLVPVLVGLVEAAVQGASARTEIDNGIKDAKESNKHYFTAMREENERWAAEKTAFIEEKAQKTGIKDLEVDKWTKSYNSSFKQHKLAVANLEYAHMQKKQAYAPRFRPLGKDHQGRIYYVSSAFSSKKIPTRDDRASLVKWSWFLAVWGGGGRTGGANNRNDTDEDASSGREEGNQREKWWGFWDPHEIKKLAKWIAAEGDVRNEGNGEESWGKDQDDGPISSRASSPLSDLSDNAGDRMDMGGRYYIEKVQRQVDMTGPTPESELKDLVKGLRDYADFLAWRSDGDEIGSEKVQGKVTGKNVQGTVTATKFYGSE